MEFLALYAAGLLLIVGGLFGMFAGRAGWLAAIGLALGFAATGAGAAAMFFLAPPLTGTPSAADAGAASGKSQERLDATALEPAVPATEAPPAEAPAQPAIEPEAEAPPVRIIETPSEAPPAPETAEPPPEIADFVDPLTQDALTAEEGAPPLPSRPPDEERAITLATLAPAAPAAQKSFIEALARGREAYDAAADDVAREAARADRSAALCGAVSSPDVENWVGSIEAKETDAGGRIALTVALPDGSLLRTWNNPMSDLDDQTLILPDTELARAVEGLPDGAPVRLSGSFFPEPPDCWRSSRLSLDQAIREPSFIFRFTSIKPLQN